MQARWCAAVVLGAMTFLGAAQRVEAQTASQVVRFRVLPASRASVEPVTRPLSTRGTAAAESRYAIGTTEPNRKILASLDRAVPGVSLSVALTPPTGASTRGAVVLDTVAHDLLTSIPVSVESGLPVRYTLNGDAAPAERSAEDRAVTVTYTVVEEP